MASWIRSGQRRCTAAVAAGLGLIDRPSAVSIFSIVKQTESIQRLAIVYPKAIGDFLFALPALYSIRRALSDVEITLVVKQKQAPLALPQEGSLCDHVMAVGGDVGVGAIRRQLAEAGVDTVLDLAGNDQSGLMMSWRSGRRIRPSRQDCKGLCALYTPFAESMPPLEPGLHRVDELLAFARYLGVDEPIYSFRLKVPDQAIEASELLIERYALRSGPVVALNLGASRESKRWPGAHVRALAEGLIQNGVRVVLTGAETFAADQHYDRRLADRLRADGVVDGERCIDLVHADRLAPDLHLQRDLYLLRYANVAEVVVGNDTGPLHMAGSVGDDAKRKTVSLFGPTNWGRYAPYDPSRSYPDTPYGKWNRVLCADVACAPQVGEEACRWYRKGCRHKQCMVQLHPDRVLKCIMEMVKA